MDIDYKLSDITGVDWAQMKERLIDDDFDNGRTMDQLRDSFANSHSFCIAYAGDDIIGTARILSDGICNAYLVDVWTYTPFRRLGIARSMIELLLTSLPGQHVYLQTDNTEFYERLGFMPRPTGMQRIVGEWLDNDPNSLRSQHFR
jgi:ribosomal protein S18 acetylase RimI-like enzyme